MKEFLRKYFLRILVILVAVFMLTLILMIVSSHPQEGGFIYQIN